MGMTRFQKLATAALVSVLVLMFVGAVVRVTGAGMGCPDWPKCWGCLIPPTRVEQVDFSKLKIEDFKRAAAKHGRNPDEITLEGLRREFNPQYVWIEFINRMTSAPVVFFTLLTFICSFWQRDGRPVVFWMAFASVMLVMANAVVGATLVYSNLAPIKVTSHLALAMSLLGTLVYCAWRGTDMPWRIAMEADRQAKMRLAVTLLLIVVVAEGILGSQVREMTDALAKLHANAARETWARELEGSWKYLVHRSFSWAVLGLTVLAWVWTKRHRAGGAGKVEKSVLSIVIAQMLLGLVMAQVHIYSWVQVLHVGLAAILLTLVWLWRFGLSREA